MAAPLTRLVLLGMLLATSARADEAAPAPVRFSDALYAKFKHARCLQCHQFNSRNHNGRSYASHRSRYLCDNCHTPRLTGLAKGEWSAPLPIMDYTDLDARDTCLLVKRNMGAGDNEARLAAHLVRDARIRWALESGMTPAGRFPAVPGGYAEWARDVRAWVADGMLCE